MTQIIMSGAISFLVAIFTTPLLIRYFTNAGTVSYTHLRAHETTE